MRVYVRACVRVHAWLYVYAVMCSAVFVILYICIVEYSTLVIYLQQ